MLDSFINPTPAEGESLGWGGFRRPFYYHFCIVCTMIFSLSHFLYFIDQIFTLELMWIPWPTIKGMVNSGQNQPGKNAPGTLFPSNFNALLSSKMQ